MFNNESQVFEIIVVHIYLRRELEQLLEKEQILQQYLQIGTIKIVIPFNDIISEINNNQINNPKVLDIVMPLYIFQRNSNNCAKVRVNLWICVEIK